MKKLISVLIAGVMMLAMATSSFAAFSDMPGGEDGAVLQKAVDNGLIQGFEDGTVRPSTPITRAQMATIMSRAMNAAETTDLSAFNDVKPGDWYYDAMSKSVAMGAFKGDDKSNLNPNNTITRQEAMIVLSRIFDLPQADVSLLNALPDGGIVATWAAKEVASVYAGGYLAGDTELRPLQPMTRLEFARIMDKIVTQYIDQDGEYTAVSGNVLVRAQNVKFTGVKGVNFYTGDGVKGVIEFTDCDFDNVIIRGGRLQINSGQFHRIRAIGTDTIVDLKITPSKILKTLPNGTKGSIYGKPGKGVVVIPSSTVEIQ